MKGGQTKLHKEQVRMQLLRMDIISRLLKRGNPTIRELRQEIMTRLGLERLSTKTVLTDKERLLREWKEERVSEYDDWVRIELKRIDELQNELWDAWEKSKRDYERKWSKQVGVPNGVGEGGEEPTISTVKMEQQTEGVNACGDPRYLELIVKLDIERRKILGIYSPEKKELTGPNGKPLQAPPIVVEIIDRADQIRPKE